MLDEQLRQIEQELRQLPLRRPPAALDNKVAQARRQAAAANRRRWLLRAAAVCAAVAVCLAAVVDWRISGGKPADDPRPAEMVQTDPIHIEQVWSSLAMEPDVLVGEGQAVRIQRNFVRRISLFDTQNNVRIQWEFPSVDSETLPLEYNQWPVEYN